MAAEEQAEQDWMLYWGMEEKDGRKKDEDGTIFRVGTRKDVHSQSTLSHRVVSMLCLTGHRLQDERCRSVTD